MTNAQPPVEITLSGTQYRLNGVVRGGFGVSIHRAQRLEDGSPCYVHLSKTVEAGRMASLLSEASLIASLDGASFGQIIDHGVERVESGQRLFMVESFCAGQTLEMILKREDKLSPGRAVHIARQVLRALGRAHGRGVLHLAIDLETIVVEDAGGADRVRLMHFQPWSLRKTSTSTVPLFEERFEAPEVGSDEVGPMADVYSAGRVLYECLVGLPVRRPVLPPLCLFPEISSSVAWAVEKSVEQGERERFQSAIAFLDALSTTDDIKLEEAPEENHLEMLEEALGSLEDSLLECLCDDDEHEATPIWVLDDDPSIAEDFIGALDELDGVVVRPLPSHRRAQMMASLREGDIKPPTLVIFGELHVLLEDELLSYFKEREVGRLLILNHPSDKAVEAARGFCGLDAWCAGTEGTDAMLDVAQSFIPHGTKAPLATSVAPWSERPFPIPS